MADGLSDKQELFVAAYLGEGPAKGNGTAAAREAGYAHPSHQVNRLLSNVVIAARIRAHEEALQASVRNRGIAEKQRRVDVLNDLAGRLLRTLEARAADPSLQHIPGGPEGVLVRQVKAVKVYASGGDRLPRDEGEDPGEPVYPTKQVRLVAEYAVDTSTLAELRATLKQAAQEVGEWTERRELTGKDGGPLEVSHRPDLSALSLEELRELEHLAQRAAGLSEHRTGVVPALPA